MLYQAQRQGELATTGAYAYVRHPQYVGFIIIIMFGFLLQWPTILTMTMFPILVPMYWRVAKAEEREAIASSGDAYRDYMTRVPASSCHASVQPRMNMEPDRKALSLADGHDPRLVRRHSAAEQRQAGNWPLVHLLEAPLSTMNERVRS